MKEVSIITFCNNMWHVNYGQVLQCYAIQEVCKKLGNKVKVVRYREKDKRDIIQHKFFWGKLNEIYENYCQKRFVEKATPKRVSKFQKFMKKNVNLTYPCYSIKDVEKVTKTSDVLLCGSDQIWNPPWITKFYTLNFGNSQQKRISYAASGIIPDNKFNEKKYRILGDNLKRFNAISLREKSGIDILKKYTNRDIIDVLDPTLLLDSESWNKVADKRLIEEPYIFCYALKGIRPYKMLLKALMKEYGVNKVAYIEATASEKQYSEKFIRFANVGPTEFLSLIKNSAMVCTDSFHGVAFSINYKKQFFRFSYKSGNSFHYTNRQEDLLKKCHISNRKCENLNDIKNLDYIDYDKVEKYLKKERKLSWEFLKKALSNS